MEEIDVIKLFNSIGFSFPENSEEKAVFESVFTGYDFKTKEESINPDKILKSIAKPKVVTRIDYHKRAVLAAEIVFQLKDEWTLGHLKLQKILYLCQNIGKMPLHANFSKQALGPYDPLLMRSLDKQFYERNWFQFVPDGNGPKYKPLEKAGEHKEWFEKYYGDYISQLDFLINTFRKTRTNEIELIATIYGCCLEILDRNDTIKEAIIIEEVYKWSPEKKKFTEDAIRSSIEWMVKTGILPESPDNMVEITNQHGI